MYVYFVKCPIPGLVIIRRGGEKPSQKTIENIYYKIGITADLGRRIKELQTGCPVPITYVGYLKMPSRMAAEDLERRFHERFVAHRTAGEWFKLSHKQRCSILELVDLWPVPDAIAFLNCGIDRLKLEKNQRKRQKEKARNNAASINLEQLQPAKHVI